MSKQDGGFFDRFLMGIGALALIGFLYLVVSDMLQDRTKGDWVREDPEALAALEDRIKPVGSVAISGDSAGQAEPESEPVSAAETDTESVAVAKAEAKLDTESAAVPEAETEPQPEAEVVAESSALDGHAIYQNACFACHMTGAGGAPITGDAAAWADRLAQGRDVLVKHAIDGFTGSLGVMLPKGGRADLSDEEVAAAVDHMIAESGG